MSLKELQEELRTLTAKSKAEQQAHRVEVDQINDTLKVMTESIMTQQQQLSDHGQEIRDIKQSQATQATTLKEILHLLSNKNDQYRNETTIEDESGVVTQTQTQTQIGTPTRQTHPPDNRKGENKHNPDGNTVTPNPKHLSQRPPRGGDP